MKIFKSITGRLLPAFFITALLPTMLLSASVYFSAKKSALLSSENIIDEQFSMVDSLIDQMLVSSATELSVVEQHESFRTFLKTDNPQGLASEFSAIMQRHPEFLQIKYLDRSGMEMIRLNRTPKGLSRTKDDELHNRSDKYYFRQAMQMSGKYIYVSGLDPNVDKEKGHIRRLVARIGVKVEKNGLLLINLDGNYIFKHILPLAGAKPAKAMLINNSGRYISYDGSSFREYGADMIRNRFGIDATNLLTQQHITQKRVKGGYLSVMPVKFDNSEGANLWYVAIYESDSEINAAVFSIMRPYMVSLWVVFVFVLLFTLLVSSDIIKKVKHLVKFIPTASEDEFTETGISEFDGIGHAIRRTALGLKRSTTELEKLNRNLETRIAEQVDKIAGMTEKQLEYQKQLREIQEELMHADRLASLGMISAAMAHEIGNPLAAMKTSLEVLRAENESEEEREFISMIISQVDKLAVFLKSITKFGKKPQAELKPADIAEVLKEVIITLEKETERNGITISIRAESRMVLCDEIQLRQVVFNILLNSVQQLSEKGGGRIDIDLYDADGACEVCITDSGGGAKEPEKMFKPFYTTKQDGTGLGLAIVNDIVKSAGWEISARNIEGMGLETTIKIKEYDK
ncbi:PAS domain-containing sensor histidine kinase [Seleniivibrio woodruffii]|uniref:sensor histidine kinase n=1 Tax=Seleniivibrio woodruffii TaxID=1078050 RepID=UPI0026F05875|nr:PAS domain-containing sensor histidine kinase [Seleniivibrio woodruffii]